MSEMKSYYFRNIVNQIIKTKKDSCIIFSLVFVMSLFLSQVYFFGYNPSVENNIANQLNLNHEIKNDFVFGVDHHGNLNDILYPKEEFYALIDLIEEIGHHHYVESYNYNLMIHRNYHLQGIPSEDLSNEWFGLSQESYLDRNRIQLIEGRGMTQEEIDTGSPVIVVPNDLEVIDERGQTRFARVGDHLTFPEKGFQRMKNIDLEVIGVYKREYKHYQIYGENDAFVNSGGSLVSNQMILNLIEETSGFDYRFMKINCISYYVADYSNNLEFDKYLVERFKEFQTETVKKYGQLIMLQLMPSKENSIITSVLQIKTIYRVVFYVVVGILCVLYISVINYLLKKKYREIKIYYSLGQTKFKIIFQYIGIYMIISSFAVLLALGLGYFISQKLLEIMVVDKVSIQSEVLRFSEDYKWMTTDTKLLTPEYQFTFVSSIKIFIEVMIVTVTAITVSIMSMFNQMIEKNGRVRKWKKS